VQVVFAKFNQQKPNAAAKAHKKIYVYAHMAHKFNFEYQITKWARAKKGGCNYISQLHCIMIKAGPHKIPKNKIQFKLQVQAVHSFH